MDEHLGKQMQADMFVSQRFYTSSASDAFGSKTAAWTHWFCLIFLYFNSVSSFQTTTQTHGFVILIALWFCVRSIQA